MKRNPFSPEAWDGGWSRLAKITYKHLLPVYDRPMVYYPIETLCRAGIEDIMVVTGGNSAGDFLRLLGNGRAFGLSDISYTYQKARRRHRRRAQALRALRSRRARRRHPGRQHLRGEPLAVHRAFRSTAFPARTCVAQGGRRPARSVRRRRRSQKNRIVGIEEKPALPKQVRRHRRLHVRYARLRLLPRPTPIGARRARDHGRQHGLPPCRRPRVRRSARLVDGCRRVRKPPPRRHLRP